MESVWPNYSEGPVSVKNNLNHHLGPHAFSVPTTNKTNNFANNAADRFRSNITYQDISVAQQYMALRRAEALITGISNTIAPSAA